jgi:hypothetical protein
MPLELYNTPDWKLLREQGLMTVVDPLVFRAADVFFQSAPPQGDEKLCTALTKNVDSLAVVTDQVMLRDRLPIFDHGITFEAEPELALKNQDLIKVCNDMDGDELLVDVHVAAGAYKEARGRAIAAVKELPDVEPSLAADIREVLSVLDYDRKPRPDDLGDLDEDASSLAPYRYHCLDDERD